MSKRILGATVAAVAFLATSAAVASPFLITPVGFDFGDVASGATSSSQDVTITNVSGATQALSLAGGAAGQFGGQTNCGTTLAADASCNIFYAFSPTSFGPATGSTTLSVNGQNASFSFQGNAIEPFLITPTSFDFGNVATGTTSSPQIVTIANTSGAAQSLSLAGGAAGQFGGQTSCGATLAAGASCQITYAFTPTASGSVMGSTTLSVNGEITSFNFKGTGGTQNAPPFLISPLSLDFGNVSTEETSSQQTVTITNVSGTTQTLSLAGGAAGQFGGQTDCGATLAAGASCHVTYAFTPTALGPATGSTTLSVNGQIVSLSFNGEGISSFLISPLAFDFGEIELGLTSPSQMVDVLNVSDVIQDLSLAGGAAGQFGGQTDCGATLAAGASCQVTYAFTPMALGPATGSTTLSVNGMNSLFSFTGIGIPTHIEVPEPTELTCFITGLIIFAAFYDHKMTA